MYNFLPKCIFHSSLDAETDVPFQCQTLTLCLPTTSRRGEEEREREGQVVIFDVEILIHLHEEGKKQGSHLGLESMYPEVQHYQ